MQGFLPVEASILEMEVWGFGGSKAKEVQSAHHKREQLFTEQRRKVLQFPFSPPVIVELSTQLHTMYTFGSVQVNLKTFGDWEDSPEKMMMDMVADPNRVKREDR